LKKNKLDIIIPVFNEGAGIISTIDALQTEIKTPFQILICYDLEDDTTLAALRAKQITNTNIIFVKNKFIGAHGAVITGFNISEADFILVMPADDNYNAPKIDLMVGIAECGADIVCASRFIDGGCMKDCPLLKATLVRSAAFSLYWLGGLPVRDATNGLRLFSRRVVKEIEIESTKGFSYSLELLAKCHRLKWKIEEIPAFWFERTYGKSKFKVLKWLPAYLRWYFYVFLTTWLRRGGNTVKMK